MSTIGLVLVLVTAVLTMAANLMLRAGIDAAGGFELGNALQILPALIKLFVQPLFTLGFVIYFVASVVWFRVIATQPLSLAYPILISLTFALVTGGAVIFFGEPLSVRKVVGLAVILMGIVIVSVEKGIT